jgi:CRP-like cAMP-binding protein
MPKKSDMRRVDVFAHLNGEQASGILALGERQVVEAGTLLGHADEPPTTFYVILSGQAELSYGAQVGDAQVDDTGAGEIAVRLAGPGESFPWAAMRGSGNLVTNCRARTDMEVVAIPIDALTAYCHENAEVGMGFYRGVMDQFAGQYGRTLAMLAANVEQELTGIQ